MMPREGAFHHLIIVSYPRQDRRSKGNGCAIQHDFMLLNVRNWVRNSEKDMDVCKCIVPMRDEGTLNNRARVASPLVWLVEGKERWEAPGLTPWVFSL
ncbi:hypothetical protein TNCV_411041 [Trichonephila clavipes]|nr:hypothetical protein TNCV_411041 [Trichonephila clavipes]